MHQRFDPLRIQERPLAIGKRVYERHTGGNPDHATTTVALMVIRPGEMETLFQMKLDPDSDLEVSERPIVEMNILPRTVCKDSQDLLLPPSDFHRTISLVTQSQEGGCAATVCASMLYGDTIPQALASDSRSLTGPLGLIRLSDGPT